MSTLQYIGARYVPKWYVNSIDGTANWEVNVEYEPLTWVTTQNNHLYLSKKTVPDNIGTPAQNTAYWLDMGQMTGDIQNIQDQIDALIANMGDLTELDTTDKSSIVNAINEVVANSGSSTIHTSRNKHIVILGDSYADESPNDYSYIIKSSGVFRQVDVVAGGGWGFTGKDGAQSGQTGPTLEWLTHFTAFINELSEDEKKDISDVYIIGGFNDHYSTFNIIISHMSDFFTYANAALPNAQYHVGLCAWAKDGTVTTPNETAAGATIRNTISSVVLPAYQYCVNYGAEYMGNFIWEMHDYINDFDSTLYHPSAASSIKIARAILSKMLGHKYEDDSTHAQNIKVSGVEKIVGAVRRNGNNIDFVSNYDNSMIFYAGADVTAANPYVIPDWYPSETYNWVGARGGANNYGFRCMIRASSPGEKFHPCDVSVDATTRKLKINSVPFNLTNNQPYRITFMNSSFSYLDC